MIHGYRYTRFIQFLTLYLFVDLVTCTGNVISDSQRWTIGMSPILLTSPVAIAPSASLTIDPGVIVKFTTSTAVIDIRGSLVVNGTAEAPVLFDGMNIAERALARSAYGTVDPLYCSVMFATVTNFTGTAFTNIADVRNTTFIRNRKAVIAGSGWVGNFAGCAFVQNCIGTDDYAVTGDWGNLQLSDCYFADQPRAVYGTWNPVRVTMVRHTTTDYTSYIAGTIKNLVCTDNAGIGLTMLRGSTIMDSVIARNKGGGIIHLNVWYNNNIDIPIIRCVISGNWYFGVGRTACCFSVVDSVITNNLGSGIMGDQVEISGSLIANNTVGLDITNSLNVKNNIIIGNKVGLLATAVTVKDSWICGMDASLPVTTSSLIQVKGPNSVLTSGVWWGDVVNTSNIAMLRAYINDIYFSSSAGEVKIDSPTAASQVVGVWSDTSAYSSSYFTPYSGLCTLPYRDPINLNNPPSGAIVGVQRWTIGMSPILLTSPVAIAPSASLTIDPGVIVKFTTSIAVIDNHGSLRGKRDRVRVG